MLEVVVVVGGGRRKVEDGRWRAGGGSLQLEGVVVVVVWEVEGGKRKV